MKLFASPEHLFAIEYEERKPDTYSWKFKIFHISWNITDDKPAFQRTTENNPCDEWVDDIKEATPFVTGFIKWDGCVNYSYPLQSIVMCHACGIFSFREELRMWEKLYELVGVSK
jgi:hypothetical protein